MNNKADECIWPMENVAYASRFYQLSIKSPCWRSWSMKPKKHSIGGVYICYLGTKLIVISQLAKTMHMSDCNWNCIALGRPLREFVKRNFSKPFFITVFSHEINTVYVIMIERCDCVLIVCKLMSFASIGLKGFIA